MYFIKVVVVVGLFVFSGTALAQESSNYNDGLKQQLKQEDVPTVQLKKIVRKRIRKADQSKISDQKKLAHKKAITKTVEIAQVSDDNAVKVKESTSFESQSQRSEGVPAYAVQPANSINSEVPELGKASSNTQKYGYQPPTYQPIYVLQPTNAAQAAAAPSANSATIPAAVAAPEVQVQPTTNVDAAKVPEPKSEQIRRQREDLEHQTESKLIEKLEDDRLSSEKDRANRILNPQPAPAATATPVAAAPGPIAVEVAAQPPAQSPAPVVAPVAATAVTPAPVVVPVQTTGSAPEVVKAESSPVPALSAATPQVESGGSIKGETIAKTDIVAEPKPVDERRISVGAMAGLPSYPTVNNISSYYTLGVIGSYQFQDHLSVQSSFDYSKFDIKNVNYCPFCYGGTLVKGMDQYNFSVGLNYNLLTGPITPIVGVLVDYARRSYTDRVTYGYTNSGPTGSNAFDAGLMAGADLKLSQNLTLGFQFAYLWNVSYWTDDPLAYGLYGSIYGSPIESLSYYLATLNLRFVF